MHRSPSTQSAFWFESNNGLARLPSSVAFLSKVSLWSSVIISQPLQNLYSDEYGANVDQLPWDPKLDGFAKGVVLKSVILAVNSSKLWSSLFCMTLRIQSWPSSRTFMTLVSLPSPLSPCAPDRVLVPSGLQSAIYTTASRFILGNFARASAILLGYKEKT